MTSEAPPLLGVLAVQGDVAAHGRALEAAGARWRPVLCARDLAGLDGLALPGGESSTMVKALREEGLWEPLARAIRPEGGPELPVLATCAGLILLARRVYGPEQPSLGLIDVEVRRNAYGRQVDSFIAMDLDSDVLPHPIEAVFIRAPRVETCGPGVAVLARRRGDPCLVRDGEILGATFHPELTPNHPVHRLFLDRVRERRRGRVEAAAGPGGAP